MPRIWLSGPRLFGGLVRPGVSFSTAELSKPAGSKVIVQRKPEPEPPRLAEYPRRARIAAWVVWGFAIYGLLALVGCVGGGAHAGESRFAHVKTAEDARAMIMGVAIAKEASQLCPGVGIDATASEELLDHCHRIIGKSAVERALAEDIKKVAKDAETGDFCEDVKGAARLGFNYLMTVDGVQTGLDDRLRPYTIHNGDGQ